MWCTFENVKADSAQLINVWVVYLCQKADFRRSHWIVVRKEELKPEYAS